MNPFTHTWPFSKSKFNLKPDRVNLVAPASPIECLLYLPDVRAIQYKLGPARKFKCTTATRALTDLPQIWIGDLGKHTEMFLAWFLHFKFSGSTFIVKNSKNRDLRLSAGNLWVTWARLYNIFILKEMDRVWIVFYIYFLSE